MAHVLAPPTIEIDGNPLAIKWSRTHKMALAGLAITWGRQRHQDEAYPAQLSMYVLDTDGHMRDSAALVGRSIVVKRGDGRVIYRGRLDDFQITHTTMLDQEANQVRRVWKLQLSAACKIAELARLTVHGPPHTPDETEALGPGYWWIQKPADRIASIHSQGANQVVAGIEWVNPYPVQEEYPAMRFRRQEDGFSALDMIEGVYNTVPMGYVNYQPATNQIALGKPTESDGLHLVYTGGKLRLNLPDGKIIPARTVAVPNGYTAKTGIAESIDVVIVASPTVTLSGGELSSIDYVTEHNTARFQQTATGRNEYRVKNDLMWSLRVPDPPSNVGTFDWPFSLVDVDPDNEFETVERPTHQGIDFPKAEGVYIPAAGTGTIIVSRYHSEGVNGGWGNFIVIDHGLRDGKRLKTLYAHMKELGLPVGTEVGLGQPIGMVGNTGNSFGSHLHLETWVDDVAIDPRIFMDLYQSGEAAPETPPIGDGSWTTNLARDTAAMFNQLNGKVKLPTLRLDFRWAHAPEHQPPDWVAETFIDTYAKDLPVYFSASVFNVLPDVSVVQQIIGGTLIYDGGWYLDANVVPAMATWQGVTVDQLVRNPAPTLSDFDPDITVADLGFVTQGVPA